MRTTWSPDQQHQHYLEVCHRCRLTTPPETTKSEGAGGPASVESDSCSGLLHQLPIHTTPSRSLPLSWPLNLFARDTDTHPERWCRNHHQRSEQRTNGPKQSVWGCAKLASVFFYLLDSCSDGRRIFLNPNIIKTVQTKSTTLPWGK